LSTFQIVELAPSLPSIKLFFSGRVSGSLDPSNHINPKLNKALPWSLQPFKSRSNVKAPISLISNASTVKPKAITLPHWKSGMLQKKNPMSSQNIPSCGDKPFGQQGTRS
jgi:hypothetical protein